MSVPVLTPESLRQRAGRVCVAVSGPNMFALAEASLPRTQFLEFRLDSVTDPASLLPSLCDFLAKHRNVIAVATCRRQPYGGSFSGNAQQQIDILTRAAHSGCQLIDIETETAEELGLSALQALRNAGAAVILSWHDFERTPDLAPQLERMQPFAPDFRKIVPTATTLRDALQLIDLLEAHSADGRLIAMSMGFCGTLTRVLGPRFGSAFTFAAPDGNAGTAPGQMSVSTLRDLYRIDAITPQTHIYAVTGQPITGSLSPRMHNTAFRAKGLDAVYLPLETDDINELQQVIQRLHVRGLSVTMPLKETVLPLLHSLNRAVEQMSACNTLVLNEDANSAAARGENQANENAEPNCTENTSQTAIHEQANDKENFAGYNTDVPGIVGPLERIRPLKGAHVLILGAGGASRAAVFGLRDAGAEVYVMNRTHARAEALAEEAGVKALRREDLAQNTFDILLNSTPYGMRNQDIEAPITQAEMRTITSPSAANAHASSETERIIAQSVSSESSASVELNVLAPSSESNGSSQQNERAEYNESNRQSEKDEYELNNQTATNKLGTAKEKIFFDLVYNPVETPLLAMARNLGLTVIPGVEMFVEQGVRQFELWTHQPAPREAMQQTVLEALS